MKKYATSLIIALMVLSTLTLTINIRHAESANPPPKEWSKTYGGLYSDQAYDVIQTSDNGYILAGRTNSYGAGGADVWLVKVNGSGYLQWSKTYGGASYDEARSIVKTSDNGYAIAGFTSSYGAGQYDFWLIKTDSGGNVLWSKTYGGTTDDEARAVIQTSDGGYALAGRKYYYDVSWHYVFWLVKTDSSGNMQWNKMYGGAKWNEAWSIVQTSDGGYALAGLTDSFGAGSFDFWLVKTDSSGNLQWSRTYGGANDDEAYSVIQTADGGYAVAGYTSYTINNADFWLVKTDSNGYSQWSKTYGASSWDDAWSIIQTSDGGYALAGRKQFIDTITSYDFWLVKTDLFGNMMWNGTYGGTSSDEAFSVIQTSDEGYALAGRTSSYGAGGFDFWLVKIGKTTPVNYTLTIATTAGGTTYPAPGTYNYVNGTTVPVTAMPYTLYRLDHWELDGSNVGSANPYSVLMNGNHTLRAVFMLINYTLTINATEGGTTNPLPGSYSYQVGTNVLVTAIANLYHDFDHWELDSLNVGSTNPYSIFMDANHTLYAVFMPINYTLNIAVTVGGNTIPSPGSYFYAGGTNASVTAMPYAYYAFDHWELDGTDVGSSNPYTLFIDNNYTLLAVFVPITYNLTITASAGGTTDPSPGVYTHNGGSTVQASAFPSVKYAFDHWELDGINFSTANPVNITMDGDHTLHAVFVYVPVHDVAVTNVTLFKTLVSRGFLCFLNVTVENQGDLAETFAVIVYANGTVVGFQQVVGLVNGTELILTFTWDTSGFAKGNYTIRASAEVVSGEKDTEDNSLIDGSVIVTSIGDVDGDFDVDIFDIVKICGSYGTKRGEVGYVEVCDINSDGKIDIYDVTTACAHYKEKDP